MNNYHIFFSENKDVIIKIFKDNIFEDDIVLSELLKIKKIKHIRKAYNDFLENSLEGKKISAAKQKLQFFFKNYTLIEELFTKKGFIIKDILSELNRKSPIILLRKDIEDFLYDTEIGQEIVKNYDLHKSEVLEQLANVHLYGTPKYARDSNGNIKVDSSGQKIQVGWLTKPDPNMLKYFLEVTNPDRFKTSNLANSSVDSSNGEKQLFFSFTTKNI